MYSYSMMWMKDDISNYHRTQIILVIIICNTLVVMMNTYFPPFFILDAEEKWGKMLYKNLKVSKEFFDEYLYLYSYFQQYI